MATIRTSSAGPGLRFRTRPLAIKKGECRRVYTRRMQPGSEHGKWQALSRDGFEVICPSKLEAANLIFLVGGKHFPRPSHLIYGDDHDEDRYLDWLLEHYFRIENCRGEVGPFDEEGACYQRRQILYWSFIRGWTPFVMAETGRPLTIYDGGMASSMIDPALRWRWSGT